MRYQTSSSGERIWARRGDGCRSLKDGEGKDGRRVCLQWYRREVVTRTDGQKIGEGETSL